jgi:hypothetical protein
LLRQFGNCQFHGTLDGDASDAFVFVDPGISRQSFVGFFAQRLQILHALSRPSFFVIASTRGRADDREHDHTEKRKQKHDPKPHRPGGARTGNFTK